MKTKYFSPSVNIIRDQNTELDYILTPNTQQVYNSIISNYLKGSRSFNLIGNYGTGKSSFVVALEQTLNKQKKHFKRGQLFSNVESFEFLNIVGDYESLTESFYDLFNASDNKSFFKNFAEYSNNLHVKGKALLIVIDEFGKFLEYASQNNPEAELYFVQKLAELANDPSREILFFTVLHQNFNAYSHKLDPSQKNEWNKVKGRFIELNFNEPVEQLLLLASKQLQNKNIGTVIPANFNELLNSIKKAHIFPLRDYLKTEVALNLYPFDILSAAVLTLALQEYAQNERSLFSFIENDDLHGINNFDKKGTAYYDLSKVYDYLNFNFFSFLSTKHNPHYQQWASIRGALERAESQFTEPDAHFAVIKSIGLLNIFTNKGSQINQEFLINYLKYGLSLKSPKKILQELIDKKIIRHSAYDNKFKIFEGSDLDIELAIDQAGQLIERVKNITSYLEDYFDFPVIPAKEISYRIGTPRFFSFVLSEEPIDLQPEDEIDGHINLVFNDGLNEEEVQSHSQKCTEAILFGFFKKTTRIEEIIYEIEKVKKVIEGNKDDKIALRELHSILEHQKQLLNHYVWQDMLGTDEAVSWYFKGLKINLQSSRELNKQLSEICKQIYHATPRFRNELINKSKLSGTISSARKRLFEHILENTEKEDLDFDATKFPPEKAIYLTLLKQTGIHHKNEELFSLGKPEDDSFQILWNTCSDFLDSTKSAKKKLLELTSTFKAKPYKLKQGFLDFWIPLFLVSKKNDYALFSENIFIPALNPDVLELINKSPDDFYIKSFDLSGYKLHLFNKYREILQQVEDKNPNTESFIETVKPFLTFYKQLTNYAKNTKSISQKAIKLRQAISETEDPEKAFFEEFPQALGYNTLDLSKSDKAIEDFTIALKESVQEINTSFDVLINKIESFIANEVIGEELSFPSNKLYFQKRYKKLKPEILKPRLKVFYQRLTSVLDDKKSWLNSIAQACIDKPMDNFTDEDVKLFKHKFIEYVNEIDNMTELSEKDINFEKEELIKLEISSVLKGLSKKFVRIPKSKYKQVEKIEEKLKEQLKDNDKSINIALLAKLLQDQFDHE